MNKILVEVSVGELLDKISILEERLLEKEQRIHNFKKTREQEKILLRRAEEKVSQFSKQEEEVKQLRTLEKSLINNFKFS